ncbi:lipopolysaccharide biosynthesis protein [Nocardioides sp. B-3]|uniref:lipopolysaccharide biosynthesis protein n=1 Tax=Nocardioides sp. B-3 TaxID=2895565 RepID=UPI0021536859|nr:polysaccharide biosynthesis protein [Nocardioides sp. B-3]UUZ58842.1 polysaccharide biosynthesis protein [Nocardioides sp. B-3]
MNVATYGFVIVASPLLGTEGYGALAASLNLMLVISVGALGLQATAARRISADPQHVAQIEDSILRVTYRAAAALGLILLVLSPLIQRVLGLDHLSTAPGHRDLRRADDDHGRPRRDPSGRATVGRAGRGVHRRRRATSPHRGAFIAWRPTEFWSVLGVGISFWAPVVVGWWALRHQRQTSTGSSEHTGMSMLKESVGNGRALFAFFALSSVDIIVARNVMTDHETGLYASGLILTKAMLFLPQFVVIVAFPTMATGSGRRKAPVVSPGLVATLGSVGTLAAWLLSGIAIRFVGGAEYAEVEPRLWIFAILGTLLSMIQLLIYSVLARRGRRSVYVVWLAPASPGRCGAHDRHRARVWSRRS